MGRSQKRKEPERREVALCFSTVKNCKLTVEDSLDGWKQVEVALLKLDQEKSGQKQSQFRFCMETTTFLLLGSLNS